MLKPLSSNPINCGIGQASVRTSISSLQEEQNKSLANLESELAGLKHMLARVSLPDYPETKEDSITKLNQESTTSEICQQLIGENRRITSLINLVNYMKNQLTIGDHP